MKRHWNSLQTAFRRIFMHFPYIVLAGALAMLPLNGAEFGILGVALLFASLLLVSKNIAEPIACTIARTGRVLR